MDKYMKFECLGEGGFGSVYRGINPANGENVALKVIYLRDGDNAVPVWVVREVSFLKEMEHENVIRLLDVVNDEKTVCLVLEYMDSDLKVFVESNRGKGRDPQTTKRFLHQILTGLTYCHGHKILHRDLKPSNILVDTRKNAVKLADFGSARDINFPRDYTLGEKVGSLWYCAPELLLGSTDYSTSADIWSVGCIFAEMVNLKPLFAGSGKIDQLKSIFRITGTPNEENWPGVTALYTDLEEFERAEPVNLAKEVPSLEPAGVDLLSKMLCLDPSRRIAASDALKHAYFHDI